jgi:hypothetical protein
VPAKKTIVFNRRLPWVRGEMNWPREVLIRAAGVVALSLAIPGLAFSSDDPCYIAYWHAEKLPELRACEATANAGDADAEFGYGLILWSGVDRPAHDHRAALDWFRKSARQGHLTAQISLGTFLAHKDVESDLRNPVEAYAWRITSGDEQGARRLRATLGESDVAAADRLALDYRTKYSYLQASRIGWWFRVTNWLWKIWPGLVILGFFLARRKRLVKKPLFVLVGTLVSFASQYLALWAFALVINGVMIRLAGSGASVDLVLWSFGLSYVLGLLAPLLGVFALYRFWVYRNWVRSSTTHQT